MNVSHKTLKLMAAAVWYIGPIILLNKGASLASDAHDLDPQGWAHSLSWIIGIVVGMIKTRYIFIKACRKNLARIDALLTPKLGQFYRARFFLFMATMITLGGFLSRASQGSFPFLVSIAALDISIGTALLLSSKVFWEQGVFSLKNQKAS